MRAGRCWFNFCSGGCGSGFNGLGNGNRGSIGKPFLRDAKCVCKELHDARSWDRFSANILANLAFSKFNVVLGGNMNQIDLLEAALVHCQHQPICERLLCHGASLLRKFNIPSLPPPLFW
ncbi:hypothetical protein AAY81_07455 [Denitrobacterium detoxificans]|nr:hypothetical protein AAY81_07455 [Denitrobacterium detoxificans]